MAVLYAYTTPCMIHYKCVHNKNTTRKNFSDKYYTCHYLAVSEKLINLTVQVVHINVFCD